MIDALNNYGQSWMSFFGPVVVQNTVFLGLVFLLLYRFRNASASARYMIGLAGLLKLLLPPFVPVQLAGTAPSTAGLLPVSPVGSTLSAIPANPAAAASAAPQIDIYGLLFALWAVVVLLYALFSVASTLRLASVLRHATPVTDDLTTRMLGDRKIRIFKADRISIPLTVGMFPRKIFVPRAWDRWTPDCRRVVVKHEMAHIKRRDGLFRVFQILTQAVYFFHPAVLLLSRRVNDYREMACDDASTGGGKRSRLDYSRFLVEIAETALQNPVACESASALVKKKNELLRRVTYQVKEDVMLSVSKRKIVIVAAVLVLSILPLSLYQSDVETAGTENAAAAKSSKMLSVDVAIKGGDQVTIDGAKSSLADFVPAMEKTVKDRRDDVVINLSCNGDVSMGAFFELQMKFRKLGLSKVRYLDDLGNGFPHELPPPDIEEKIKTIPEKHIAVLKIDTSGEVFLDESGVEVSKLGQVMEQRLTDNEYLIVSIHPAENTKYSDFVRVLMQIKKAGAQRVLINDPRA